MPLDLSKHEKLGVSFRKAGDVVQKLHIAHERPAVYLVVDRSGSMRRYFRDGTVQTFAERVLAAAAHFDDDGRVPVIFFSTNAHPPVDIDVQFVDGAIGRMHKAAGDMGTTNYVDAMRTVAELHRATKPAGYPAFVVFQTDGAPNNRRQTTETLVQLAHDPIHWAFVGFGDERVVPEGEEARFDYLRRLDEMRGRVVDNATFFPAGADPNAVPEEVLYANMMNEFPSWLADARAKGIVRY